MTIRRRNGVGALLAALGIFVVTPARAVTAFPFGTSSLAAWETAVAGLIVEVENFESVPANDIPVGTSSQGILKVTITPDNTGTLIQNNGQVNGSRELQGRVCDGSFSPCGPTTFYFDIELSRPVVAFGADWKSATNQDILTLTVREGTQEQTKFELDDYLTSPGDGFFGIVDSRPFTRVTLGLVDVQTQVLEGFYMDNVRLATVPLPPAFGLLAGALGILAGMGHRRRR